VSYYVHHVPGRLRVKSPVLKRNEPLARLAKQHVDGMNGVVRTEVNSVIGSIVIQYDPCVVEYSAIMRELRDLGYIPSLHIQQELKVQSNNALARKIAGNVFDKVMGTLVERSAVALIAALIGSSGYRVGTF
jgi:hypothetical protein